MCEATPRLERGAAGQSGPSVVEAAAVARGVEDGNGGAERGEAAQNEGTHRKRDSVRSREDRHEANGLVLHIAD